MKVGTRDVGRTTTVRTFLIADVRGYTRFTRERGDAEAARLAKRFAEVARDSVEARGGRVIELRGDEALAVFESAPQAVRAALEFQAACAEETAADPALPLTVGIGIDVGEAVPVEEGFRGAALNTAARLCSKAEAGQVLVTRAVAELAEDVDDVGFEDRGAAELKGFERSVTVIEAVSVQPPAGFPAPAAEREPTAAHRAVSLPPELDVLTPLVARDQGMHWLRGTWRQARRGRGRVVFLSGPAQIGKTRLVAELASEIAGAGGRIRYAGPGGAAAALAIGAVREATEAAEPTLVVLDDMDVSGEETAGALADAQEAIRSRPAMVIGVVKDPTAGSILAALIDEADRSGDCHVRLPPLDLGGVEGIARLYVGDEVQDVPLESMARASGGVPGRVHEVVSEWARDEAGRRLAAAAEWLAEGRGRRATDLEFANNVIGLKLGRLYGGEGHVAADSESPYKGLASFEEQDAQYFFGRERLVGELAARTVQVGLLGLVGASGSGKSSVVAAGLLPSLRAGLLPGSKRWRSVALRPGAHPMAEMASALSRVGPLPSDGNALEAAIDAVGDDGRLVVAIDQFEEVFTLCTDEDERNAFIQAITGAALRRPERVLIVLTIRDDFYGRCAPYRELSELVTANHVLVPPMSRDELRRAIELPARRVRLRVEAALTDALVAEVAEEPGGLPLLSTALLELWQAREDGWLRMDAYRRTGGVRGAVARLAEASYEQLGDAEREVARRIFLRLAGISKGDVVTRRRVPVSEFDADTDPVAADVLARLTQDRLLTMSDSTVEVAHEALLREWPRLRGWLEEDLQGHQLRQHLTEAAKQWEASGREPSELYRGARLSAALDWASTRAPDLNQLEREFLAASRQASEREAVRQRRSNRRLRGLLVGTAVLLVVALVAGGLALVQRGRAQEQGRIASARELGAAAVANLEADPERSILLALEAVDRTRSVDGTVLPEAEEALHRAVVASRTILTVPGVGGWLDWSPDGERFVTEGPEDTGVVDIRNADTGESMLSFPGHDVDVNGVAFSSDGSMLATTGDDGAAKVWDPTSGEELGSLQGPEGPVLGPSFSPDGSLAAAAWHEEGTVRIWNPTTGRMVREIRSVEDPYRTGFSPDGRQVGIAGLDRPVVVVVDARSGEDVFRLKGHAFELRDVDWSPDGRWIATSALDETVRIWDAQTGNLRFTLFHDGAVADADWSPDSTRLVSGGGGVTVWEVTEAGGKKLFSLSAQEMSAGIQGVAFSPDGDRVMAGDGGITAVKVWDVTRNGDAEWANLPGDPGWVSSVGFTASGGEVVASGAGGSVAIWDAEAGRSLRSFQPHSIEADPVLALDVSPDGTLVATTGTDGAARVWDAATGDEVFSIPYQGFAEDVDWSPDGRLLAVAAEAEGVTKIVDRSGAEVAALHEEPGFGPLDVDFGPDGRLLAIANTWTGRPDPTRARVKIWDWRRGEVVTEIPVVSEGIDFHPSGQRIAIAHEGLAGIWDVDSGRKVATFAGHEDLLWDVAFSPDGSVLATGGFDTTVRLWDVESEVQLVVLRGHRSVVGRLAFSPDGSKLASGAGDGTVRVWALDLDDLIEIARDELTRKLTEEECRQYLHGPCP